MPGIRHSLRWVWALTRPGMTTPLPSPDDLGLGEARRQLLGRADGGDGAVAADGHRPVAHQLGARRHRQHPGPAHQRDAAHRASTRGRWYQGSAMRSISVMRAKSPMPIRASTTTTAKTSAVAVWLLRVRMR